MYDVLIAGAGVIGGMLARELSKYRLRVCLLEKENDVAMGASRANSGIIHGGYDPVPGTLKAKLNTRGVALLYKAAEELHVPHAKNGSLVCAFSPEENETLHGLLLRGRENGLSDLELLTGEQARELEPNLSDAVTGALLVPGAGIICPYALTIAAVGNAMDNGVELKRNFHISGIHKEDNCFVAVSDHGEQVRGTYLVNCAGGYADKLAQMAGDGFFKIIPRAGEYMLLDKTEGARVKHTIFQVPTKAGKGILVTPTADGNLLVGPTAVKVDAPDSTQTTPEGLADVARLAAKSVPSVDFRQVITSFSGVRASEGHDDFIIQASQKVSNLVHAAAIDSPGLTASVAIAEYVTQILRQLGLQLEEKKEWNGCRKDMHGFRKLSDEEKDSYIQKNPAYGKIVCRCETVSEGEILDAIRTNPQAMDVDGVKRRTRSGMGRCQGGFCAPYVMKLIARELGIPMEEVSKCGSGSELLSGKR